jgi:hypothetical protein
MLRSVTFATSFATTVERCPGGGEGKTIILGPLARGLARAMSVSLLAKSISSPGEEEGGCEDDNYGIVDNGGGRGRGDGEDGGAAGPNSWTWQGSCNSSWNSNLMRVLRLELGGGSELWGQGGNASASPPPPLQLAV